MSTQAIWRPMGLLLAAVLWLAASGLAAKAQSYAYGDDPTSSFSELDGYGDWFEHPEWGTVWAPHVDRDWRPYTVGSWAFTDEHGWYWESDEPFGWAVFHYGRWVFEDGAGWLWVPGTEWAPAWVAWRYSDEYVGWAPLPPRAEWREGAGLFFEDSYFNTGLSSVWFFVRPRNLLSPTVWRYRLPPSS
jgi:hypothetical protein